MTTLEHAMLGVCGVVAVGVDRRLGWQIIPMAAVAGITPDWDGLTIAGGMDLMDQAHRVWGHNLFVSASVAAAWAAIDYRFDLVTRCAAWLGRFVKLPLADDALRPRQKFDGRTFAAWLLVAVLCAWVHLPADMLVSGGTGLSDWLVQLWWPLSDQGYVFACVPWGDPTLSVLFGAGAVAMAMRPGWRQVSAAITLVCIVAYIAGRGSLEGAL